MNDNDASQSSTQKQNPVFFNNESREDKKLEDLKLLVENLKLIRERQIKMQEKLDIYQEVGRFKPTS